MRLGKRLRRLWRDWQRWRARTKPVFDPEAVEIARIEALIERLEVAAMVGSITAAGKIAAMAEDRVGQARRRLAQAALTRLSHVRDFDAAVTRTIMP